MNSDKKYGMYINYIESAEKMSEKRMTQNNIYLTINLAFISYLVSKDFDEKKYVIMTITGILICIKWFITIANYAKRNSIKFEIINNSEYGQLYSEEWKKGEKIKKITTYEKITSIFFGILYIVLLIINFL